LHTYGVQPTQVVLRLSDFNQLLSDIMQRFGNRLWIERRNQTVGWGGETERENGRVEVSLIKVQLPTAVCVTIWTSCCSQSDVLRTCAFMATVDVIEFIFSKMCFKM